MLANKQDSPSSFSVEEIRESYEDWWQRRNMENRSRNGGEILGEQRMASLDVMGVSALEGFVIMHHRFPCFRASLCSHLFWTGLAFEMLLTGFSFGFRIVEESEYRRRFLREYHS